MELKVKMKLNPKQSIEVTFDSPNLQDVVLEAGALLSFDGVCGYCKSENIGLQTRVTKEKGYKYTEFVCNDCKAKRQFGEYRDGSGYFLKSWEPQYESGEKE